MSFILMLSHFITFHKA